MFAWNCFYGVHQWIKTQKGIDIVVKDGKNEFGPFENAFTITKNTYSVGTNTGPTEIAIVFDFLLQDFANQTCLYIYTECFPCMRLIFGCVEPIHRFIVVTCMWGVFFLLVTFCFFVGFTRFTPHFPFQSFIRTFAYCIVV